MNYYKTPKKGIPMIHGIMKYGCKDCGIIFTIGLENGVEDNGKNGRESQPCPFTIKCVKCGGYYARDISGYIPYITPTPITETGLKYYFAYDNSKDDYACGKLRTY